MSKKPTGTFKTHDHYANQTGTNQPTPKPTSPRAPNTTGLNKKPTNPGSKAPRQAEEAAPPDGIGSNGGGL